MKSFGFKAIIIFEFVLAILCADFNPEEDVLFVFSDRGRALKKEKIYRFNEKEQLRSGTLNPSKQNVFVVHGYMEDRTADHHAKLCR